MKNKKINELIKNLLPTDHYCKLTNEYVVRGKCSWFKKFLTLKQMKNCFNCKEIDLK